MAFCNLGNFSLEVWNLLQLYFFELCNWGSLKRVQTESSFEKRERIWKILNVWNLKIWLKLVIWLPKFNLQNAFLEVWKQAQMYHLWIGWFVWPQQNSKKKLIWKNGSHCGGNLKISLNTVRHLASCNLLNFGVSLVRFHVVRHFSKNLTGFVDYSNLTEIEHWVKMGQEKS